jgi:hypothetical protein
MEFDRQQGNTALFEASGQSAVFPRALFFVFRRITDRNPNNHDEGGRNMQKRVLTINGVERTFIANPDKTLASVLREQFLLTGCKVGCGTDSAGLAR